jgi:hypothetical protein
MDLLNGLYDNVSVFTRHFEARLVEEVEDEVVRVNEE